MEELCRVCLVDDVRMCLITDTHLQEVYESLTMAPLETKDSRPVRVCYICRAELQNCYRLRKKCIQSEELLTQVLSSGHVIQPLKTIRSSCMPRLKTLHPLIHISADPDTADIKIEPHTKQEHYVEIEDMGAPYKVKIEKITEPSNLESDDMFDEGITNDDTTGPTTVKKPRVAKQKITTKTTSSNVKAKSKAGSDVKPHKCDVCERAFKKAYMLKEHKLTHTDIKPHQCHECGACFRTKTHLRRHSIRHAGGEKTFECEICKKRFSHKDYWKAHMLRHSVRNSGEKPYECEICKRRFRLKDSCRVHMRRVHLRTHPDLNNVNKKKVNIVRVASVKKESGHKMFQCTVCGKHLQSRVTLKFHSVLHTGEKPYECDVCKKCFATPVGLRSHKITHMEERPYKCDICDLGFKTPLYLRNHKLTHTDIKPYQCHLCGKHFRTKTHLRLHNKVHTGEKSHECEVCKKRFALSGNWRAHMRTHSDVKPFKCTMCDESFKQRSSLQRHIVSHKHGRILLTLG